MEYNAIIPNFLNTRFSQLESLGLVFVIILRIFFCEINTCFALEELSQKIIP
jgi:hypothetical protein